MLFKRNGFLVMLCIGNAMIVDVVEVIFQFLA